MADTADCPKCGNTLNVERGLPEQCRHCNPESGHTTDGMVKLPAERPKPPSKQNQIGIDMPVPNAVEGKTTVNADIEVENPHDYQLIETSDKDPDGQIGHKMPNQNSGMKKGGSSEIKIPRPGKGGIIQRSNRADTDNEEKRGRPVAERQRQEELRQQDEQRIREQDELQKRQEAERQRQKDLRRQDEQNKREQDTLRKRQKAESERVRQEELRQQDEQQKRDEVALRKRHEAEAERERQEEHRRQDGQQKQILVSTDIVFFEPSPAANSPVRGGCAVDDNGTVYFCSQNKIYCLQYELGKCREKWSFDLGGGVPGSPVIGSDGNIRVHSSDGNLYVFSPSGEQTIAAVAVGNPYSWSSPLIDDQNATWLSVQGGIVCVANDGSTSRRPFYRTRQKLDCTGVIWNDSLIIGAEDNCVYSIDLSGKAGKNQWSHADDRGRTGWYVNSAVARFGESLIVASGDDCVYAFHADGSILWKRKMKGRILSSPIIDADGFVYVGTSTAARGESGQGFLVCIDPESNEPHWIYDGADTIESTPLLGDDNKIYFGDNTGQIHAVNRHGKEVWTKAVGVPIRSPITILPNQMLAFGTDDGRLAFASCEANKPMESSWSKHMGNLANRAS